MSELERDARIVDMVREFEEDSRIQKDKQAVKVAYQNRELDYQPIDEDEFLIKITNENNKPKFTDIELAPVHPGLEGEAMIEIWNNSPFSFTDLQIKSQYFNLNIGKLLSGHKRELTYDIAIPENIQGDYLEIETQITGSYTKELRYA